jgi:hypothetical protein
LGKRALIEKIELLKKLNPTHDQIEKAERMLKLRPDLEWIERVQRLIDLLDDFGDTGTTSLPKGTKLEEFKAAIPARMTREEGFRIAGLI